MEDLYGDGLAIESTSELEVVLAKTAKIDRKLRKMRKKSKKARKARKAQRKKDKQQPSLIRDTFVASVPSIIDLTAAVIRKR